MNGKPVFTVPAKTIINFESGFSHKLLCTGPTFSAGSACPFSCSFCYVPSQMNKQRPWLEEHGVTGKHEDVVIRRDNAVEIVRKQLMSKPEEYRKSKQTIYASPLTDVAANLEFVRETVEICKVILELTNWDIRLLSKSNLLHHVAELFEGARKRIIYGVSTGTLDDKLAAAFESGCPLVSKRIQSLRRLQDNGHRTFGMICPSLPQVDYDRFAKEMCEAIRVDRCEHIWAEVMNARGESFTRTYDALVDGGFTEADGFAVVSKDKDEWEKYARATFEAEAKYIPKEKFRFMQYPNKGTESWWKERGALLL